MAGDHTAPPEIVIGFALNTAPFEAGVGRMLGQLEVLLEAVKGFIAVTNAAFVSLNNLFREGVLGPYRNMERQLTKFTAQMRSARATIDSTTVHAQKKYGQVTGSINQTATAASTLNKRLLQNVPVITQTTRDLTRVFTAMRWQFLAFGMILSGTGYAIARYFKSAAKAVGDFADTLTRVFFITGALEERMGGLRKEISDFVRKMGVVSVFEPQQVARGVKTLSQLGLGFESTKKIYQDVLDFALLAEKEDIGKAASEFVGVLRGFGIPLENSRRALDMMSTAMITSRFEMSELAQGMRRAITTHTSYGQSLSTITALASALRDRQFTAVESFKKVDIAARNLYSTVFGLGPRGLTSFIKIGKELERVGEENPFKNLFDVDTGKAGNMIDVLFDIVEMEKRLRTMAPTGESLIQKIFPILDSYSGRGVRQIYSQIAAARQEGHSEDAIRQMFPFERVWGAIIGRTLSQEGRAVYDIMRTYSKTIERAQLERLMKYAPALREALFEKGKGQFPTLIEHWNAGFKDFTLSGREALKYMQTLYELSEDVSSGLVEALRRTLPISLKDLSSSFLTFNNTTFGPFVDEFVIPSVRGLRQILNSLTEISATIPQITKPLLALVGIVGALSLAVGAATLSIFLFGAAVGTAEAFGISFLGAMGKGWLVLSGIFTSTILPFLTTVLLPLVLTFVWLYAVIKTVQASGMGLGNVFRDLGLIFEGVLTLFRDGRIEGRLLSQLIDANLVHSVARIYAVVLRVVSFLKGVGQGIMLVLTPVLFILGFILNTAYIIVGTVLKLFGIITNLVPLDVFRVLGVLLGVVLGHLILIGSALLFKLWITKLWVLISGVGMLIGSLKGLIFYLSVMFLHATTQIWAFATSLSLAGMVASVGWGPFLIIILAIVAAVALLVVLFRDHLAGGLDAVFLRIKITLLFIVDAFHYFLTLLAKLADFIVTPLSWIDKHPQWAEQMGGLGMARYTEPDSKSWYAQLGGVEALRRYNVLHDKPTQKASSYDTAGSFAVPHSPGTINLFEGITTISQDDWNALIGTGKMEAVAEGAQRTFVDRDKMREILDRVSTYQKKR